MNSSKKWNLKIDPSVFKVLKKIPRDKSEHILETTKFLPVNPCFGDIQKMKGKTIPGVAVLDNIEYFIKLKYPNK